MSKMAFAGGVSWYLLRSFLRPKKRPSPSQESHADPVRGGGQPVMIRGEGGAASGIESWDPATSRRPSPHLTSALSDPWRPG